VGKAKPPVHRLCELTDGQLADFFALLAERSRGATRDGKPFYPKRITSVGGPGRR
jgi:hypothetical protein